MKATAIRLPTIAYLLAFAAVLTACDATKWPLADYRSPWPPARQAAPQPTVDPAMPRRRAVNPAAKPASGSAAGDPAIASASSTTTTSVSAINDPILIGLDSEQARALLGSPTEEEQRAPARIWRYRTSRCSLDVAFYPDVQTREFRVLNYEVKGNDGTEQGRRDCIAGLRTGHRTR